MLLKSWRMQVVAGREQTHKDFAENVYLPLLRSQEGCLGAYFSLSQQDCLALSIWHDQAVINALEQNPAYQELVQQWLNQGVVADSQSTEIWQVYSGYQLPGLPLKLAELSQQALLVKELN